MITFVALLMFLQLGEGWGRATLLCSLLTLPWVLKSFVRAKLERQGHLALWLRVTECLIFAMLVVLAFSFEWSTDRTWRVFASLFVLSVLCAAHELMARIHYEHMLRPPVQRLYNVSKMFVSQAVVIITYGIMIVGVGFLEVFYHNRRDALSLSWSMAVYVLAGLYLLFIIYNIIALPGSSRSQYAAVRDGSSLDALPATASTSAQASSSDELVASFRAEVRVLDRIMHKPHWLRVLLGLMFLLLPQALMFHARVLFFIAPRSEGGLGATLQEIGLAQGTVGVMAFSLGLVLGHWLTNSLFTDSLSHRNHGNHGNFHSSFVIRHSSFVTRHSSFIIHHSSLFLLPLSPLVYWHLSFLLPTSLTAMCAATFVAQLLFGFGLNACRPYVSFFSGNRYRSTTGYFYIPLVALSMLPAMAVSGYLVECLGFHTFFAINAAAIPLAWLAAAMTKPIINNK